MRTEVEEIPVVLTVPTTVQYQFDDSSPDAPHYYCWKGKTVCGPTKKEAKLRLGLVIGGAVWDEEVLGRVS